MDFRVDRYPKFNVSIRPDDRIRALVEKAPRAEAAAEKAVRRFQPSLSWLYAFRRKLGTVAVGVIAVWLFIHVMFGANGMVVYKQKRAEYQNLQKELATLQQENDRYNQQIKALKSDTEAIEKEAREQLHYVRPGEVVYVSPAPPPAQAPEVHSATK
ncbi:MAG TPA: septum formation initiator family protein [Terriglobales bacterium]|jgi:cell division protein FtsB|nr:septum formation initiator family protein [Terriglobales bacterium]